MHECADGGMGDRQPLPMSMKLEENWSGAGTSVHSSKSNRISTRSIIYILLVIAGHNQSCWLEPPLVKLDRKFKRGSISKSTSPYTNII